jgi:hypothetical protein
MILTLLKLQDPPTDSRPVMLIPVKEMNIAVLTTSKVVSVTQRIWLVSTGVFSGLAVQQVAPPD